MYELEIFARPGYEKRLEDFIARRSPGYTKYAGLEHSNEIAFVARGDGKFILECVEKGASYVSRGLFFTKRMRRI